MGTRNSLPIVVLIAALAAVPVAALAQTQNQNPQSANQTQSQPPQAQQPQAQQPQAQQPQNSPQNQGQPQQKQSFWQKMKQSTLQNMQNSTQQGTQQVQQGAASGVQQGTQAIQQGAQAALGGGNSGNATLGGSNSSGSCGATCFNAGPFLANVSQMTMSQQGPWHVISMNIQFQNSTNQPLVIAYHDGSMIMTDNNGATYQGAGGNPGELQGMGIDRGAQTDPQFVLNPGQTSSAMFSVARGRPASSPIGTGYSYNLTIDELQTQNGATAIVLRSYNLNFPTLTPGTGGSLTSFQSGSAGSAVGGNAATNSRVTNGTVPAMQTSGTATVSPSTGMTNAAMKSPVGATAKPSAAVVKPIPATTPVNANKTSTTNNKQAPSTNKKQPSTTTPSN